MKSFSAIILAAGKGRRMGSKLPKVLHSVGGKPMIKHVVDAAAAACDEVVVVHGHDKKRLAEQIEGQSCIFVHQPQLLGTGHAVQCALRAISAERVVVLYADVPLISTTTLLDIREKTVKSDLIILTMFPENPAGYGRIVRNFAKIPMAVVEEKDADDSQKAITEVNTGIIAARADRLANWLERVGRDNAQREFYLPDVVALAFGENSLVEAVPCKDPMEVYGVNDLLQLHRIERIYQLRYAEKLAAQGVIFKDMGRVDFRGDVHIGGGTVVDINVVISGQTTIGEHCCIDPGVSLTNAHIGDNVHIRSQSVIEGAHIANGCTVGPFAHLRPGTRLEAGVRIGNYVEVKNASIDEGSKVPHLSYVGDAILGRNINLGAGTITCNYDGQEKHMTRIGDESFIGSGTQLIAPIELGHSVRVGAGSVINRDIPDNTLALNRADLKFLKRK